MEYYLSQSVTRIGRAADSDLVVHDDKQVSRYHAEIRREGGAHVLRDLQSRNGTLVNGRPVTTHRLRDGDQIAIGQARLTYRNGALLVDAGYVTAGRRGRAPVQERWVPEAPARTTSTTVIAVTAAVILVVAVILVAVVLPGGSTDDSVTGMARDWVHGYLPRLAQEIASSAAITQIPLPPEVRLTKVHSQISDDKNWVFSTPEKVAEDVYRLQATATFNIALTDPAANYSVRSVYDLTLNMATSTVTEDGPRVSVTEQR